MLGLWAKLLLRFPALSGALWKLGAGAVVALLLWGAYGLWHHAVFTEGAASRDAYWQPKWDKHLADDTVATAAAEAVSKEQQARTDEALARNKEIERALSDRTAEATALKRDRDLARLLLRVAEQTAAGRRAVPEAAGESATADPTGAGGDEPLESTLAAAFGECRRNADRYQALIDEIKPQL